MTNETTEEERFVHISSRFTESEMAHIDRWRAKHRIIPSRAAAVRYLAMAGVKAEEKKNG